MSAPSLQSLGKLLLGAGLVLAFLGMALWLFGRLGGVPRLPGDLVIRRDGWSLYAPFGWMLLVSLLLTLALNLFFRR